MGFFSSGWVNLIPVIGPAISAKNAYDKSSDAQDAADAALGRTEGIADSQYELYKGYYQPGIRKLAGKLTEGIPLSVSQGAPVAAATTAGTTGVNQGATAVLSRGVAPSSGNFQRTVAGGSTNAALNESQVRNAAKQSASDIMFARKLGLVQTGRGIPGQLTTNYTKIAENKLQQADMWGKNAAENTATAVRQGAALLGMFA